MRDIELEKLQASPLNIQEKFKNQASNHGKLELGSLVLP